MDSKDLHEGNWYYYKGQPVKLSKHEMLDIYYKDTAKDYEPIPLSEDWFISAEFEKSRYIASGIDEVIFTLNDINIVCKKNNKGYYHHDTMAKLFYVHQLQDLFKVLKDQELEFKQIYPPSL